MNLFKNFLCDSVLIALDFGAKEIECLSDYIEMVRGEEEKEESEEKTNV